MDKTVAWPARASEMLFLSIQRAVIQCSPETFATRQPVDISHKERATTWGLTHHVDYDWMGASFDTG